MLLRDVSLVLCAILTSSILAATHAHDALDTAHTSQAVSTRYLSTPAQVLAPHELVRRGSRHAFFDPDEDFPSPKENLFGDLLPPEIARPPSTGFCHAPWNWHGRRCLAKDDDQSSRLFYDDCLQMRVKVTPSGAKREEMLNKRLWGACPLGHICAPMAVVAGEQDGPATVWCVPTDTPSPKEIDTATHQLGRVLIGPETDAQLGELDAQVRVLENRGDASVYATMILYPLRDTDAGRLGYNHHGEVVRATWIDGYVGANPPIDLICGSEADAECDGDDDGEQDLPPYTSTFEVGSSSGSSDSDTDVSVDSYTNTRHSATVPHATTGTIERVSACQPRRIVNLEAGNIVHFKAHLAKAREVVKALHGALIVLVYAIVTRAAFHLGSAHAKLP